MRSAQCLAQVSALKPPHLRAEEEEHCRRVQAASRPRRSKNGVRGYGAEMNADSFPPTNRGSNSNHLRNPKALRTPSAGVLLPSLLRLDCPHCVEPQLHPQTVRRLDQSSNCPRLTGHPPLMRPAYVISTLRALRVCPRSGTWGTGLGVSAGAATGPALKPPDSAPLNPRHRTSHSRR